MLAAAPLAAARGAETIRQGGNAYDAVVVAALIETVMLPSKCGLAGDLVSICLGPGDESPLVLLAIGEAAEGLAAAARDRGLKPTGPLSVGVPGAPAGYTALSTRGRLPFEQLIAPAVDLATNGFVWAGINHSLSVESQRLVETANPEPNSYFPDGHPLPANSVVRLPGLARLLEEFTVLRETLFASHIGERVAAYVTKLGGVLRVEDLQRTRAEWTEPLSVRCQGRTVWTTPAPTHGPALLEALSGLADSSAGTLWDRLQVGMAVRDRLSESSGTSIVSAADSEGNVAVVIHSNSFPRFGSGLVVPDYDLILNNRAGRGFSPDPDHPNFPAPRRRPATTLHAWAASDASGGPAFLGGTPGGDNQMPWNLQLLAQFLGGETDPGKLVVAPRWELGTDHRVIIEDGLDSTTVAELEARATAVEHIPRWGLRSAFQVIAVPRMGEALVGAVDPRTGGAGAAV